MSAYEKEEILAPGLLCLIANRMEYWFSTLKIGAFRKGGSRKSDYFGRRQPGGN